MYEIRRYQSLKLLPNPIWFRKVFRLLSHNFKIVIAEFFRIAYDKSENILKKEAR